MIVNNIPVDDEDKTLKKKKVITKAELARRMLKKKIAVNKKTVFEDKKQVRITCH